MSQHLRPLLTVLSTLTLVGLTAFWLSADPPAPTLGNTMDNFTLKDTQGRSVSLADFKDSKAIVVVFVGTECPINNLSMSTLRALHKEFAPQGVQLLAINANRQDTPQEVAAHAQKHELPFPVLLDHGNVIADRFGARRTPEAFVLDAKRALRYQGRVDDQFGIDYQRPLPTRRDLAEALREVLAGEVVSRPTTPVAGCLIGRVASAPRSGTVTYSKHVARILQKNCQECHRPGQIGPMSLLSYQDASAWADTIKEVVQEQRMPPWHADPRHGKFANDRRLSPQDRDTLLAWIAHGTPRGDDRELPPPLQFPQGWTIGKPDLVLTMPTDFDVPANTPKGGIPYKHFIVETNFTEDRWVERAEVKPGATEVVHHVLVFILPAGQTFFVGNPRMPVLNGTAPGDSPLILPPGTGRLVPKGARLVFQLHYTPNGKAQKDRSSIGLIFAKETPKRRLVTWPIMNPFFRIPAGEDNYQVESTFTFQRDGHVLAYMPHMHLRGKDFLFRAVYPDGRKETLLSVPRFNFNWQSVYRTSEPLFMAKGTKIECIAHFDNSTGNPNNPDPSRNVFWGDQTWEEMMIGWLDIAYDLSPPATTKRGSGETNSK